MITRALALGAFAIALAAGAAEAGQHQVIIEATGLRPPLLRTTVTTRVIFVNRSGRLVHIEFGGEPHGHKVFQVPGQIWATFHQPGPHPYAVHFENPAGELRGLVEAVEDPEGLSTPPTCDGVELPGVCIER